MSDIPNVGREFRLMAQVNELEESMVAERAAFIRASDENLELHARIKELEEELKRKEYHIDDLEYRMEKLDVIIEALQATIHLYKEDFNV